MRYEKNVCHNSFTCEQLALSVCRQRPIDDTLCRMHYLLMRRSTCLELQYVEVTGSNLATGSSVFSLKITGCLGVCICLAFSFIYIKLLCTCIYIYVIMRDEKEERKKQARSNKQQGKATQHTQGSHFF